MMSKECSLIRELFPLYAENLVSEETIEYIREHLTECNHCSQEWELFSRPLPDPLPMEEISPQQSIENRVFGRLKKTFTIVVLLLAIGGAGLAYASFHAGKHIGMDDPAYRFAQELGLFTEIKQTKVIGGLQVTLEKGLFDSTRSVLFISLSEPYKDMPQVSLFDDNGNQYEQKRGKGWQNQFYMLEFEPLHLETEQVNVSLVLDEQKNDGMDFNFPVDVIKTAQYTTIIYPNQEKKLTNLKISLDKAVLGVSESEFKVRFDWPVDGSVTGISLGRGMVYFPTSVKKAPDTLPNPGLSTPPPGGLMSGYAATYGVNYRQEDPQESRPVLYDLSGRQEVEVEGGEYRTSQFPCQVVATLKFAPVKQEVQELELLLPPVYLYKKVEDSPKLSLDFQDQKEIKLDISVPYSDGKVVIEKALLEKDQVYLSYRLEPLAKSETILPYFELTDTEGMKQGKMRFDRQEAQVIIFYLFNEGTKKFNLSLDSMGQLQHREKFVLDIKGQ